MILVGLLIIHTRLVVPLSMNLSLNCYRVFRFIHNGYKWYSRRTRNDNEKKNKGIGRDRQASKTIMRWHFANATTSFPFIIGIRCVLYTLWKCRKREIICKQTNLRLFRYPLYYTYLRACLCVIGFIFCIITIRIRLSIYHHINHKQHTLADSSTYMAVTSWHFSIHCMPANLAPNEVLMHTPT